MDEVGECSSCRTSGLECDILLVSIYSNLETGLGSLKVIGSVMTSCWRSIATVGLSRTVSEINDDFRRKSHNFHTPCTYAPADGVLLGNWVSALRVQKTRMMGYRTEKKSLSIGLTFNPLDTVDERNKQTDRHRSTAKTAITHSDAR